MFCELLTARKGPHFLASQQVKGSDLTKTKVGIHNDSSDLISSRQRSIKSSLSTFVKNLFFCHENAIWYVLNRGFLHIFNQRKESFWTINNAYKIVSYLPFYLTVLINRKKNKSLIDVFNHFFRQLFFSSQMKIDNDDDCMCVIIELLW